MHVARARWPSSNGKTYESIYLRESFRQDGKVKKRDIANLTHCDPAEIAAIELDRKSTRLNSSHLGISYAVFCLKKKKTKHITPSSSETRSADTRAVRLHHVG